MNKRSLRILEYNKILGLLAEHAGSAMAKKRCERMKPQRDIETINVLQEETRDALLRLHRQGNLFLLKSRGDNFFAYFQGAFGSCSLTSGYRKCKSLR